MDTNDTPEATKLEPAKPEPACPLCGKPRVQAYRPFCSKRCADIDLSRWLKGVYVVPGTAESDEDGLGEDPSADQ